MALRLVATCLFGLEKQLGEEIDALGLKRLDTIDGRVTFLGELCDIPRANINLRLAERIYILVGSYPATSFTELFDGAVALPWEDYIGKYDEFPVKGHAIKSKLFSVPDCQSIVKKALVERLSKHYNIKWFAENSGVKYQIEFFILKDNVTLMIDLSGDPLHKRGYLLRFTEDIHYKVNQVRAKYIHYPAAKISQPLFIALRMECAHLGVY